MPIIQAEPLRRLAGAIFAAAGCAADESARIGRSLIEANLTGHDSHGIVRVPRYLAWIGDGTLRPGQEVRVVGEAGAFVVLDGNFGFGQTIGPQAVRRGIDMAARLGAAVVALRNTGHLGRIGDWAEMAAEAGLVSLHFVNVGGSLLVAPFGAAERRMSTSPIAIGVPADPPLILDFATSVVAEGKVLVAAKGGPPLPAGSLIDADGTLSADPSVLYGDADPRRGFDPAAGPGALRAMGEHKGSGLAFMCELLAGALTGSGCAGPAAGPIHNGMLSVYLDPAAIASDHSFAAEARAYADFFKGARPAAADGEVLVPGEPERRRRAERLADGIELPDDVWRTIVEAALGLGIDAAEVAAAGADTA